MADSLSNMMGQRVTLITVKDIRYEGTMHAFNTADYTVTLNSVRTMGTEDRATPVKVHPSKTVYQFVIFNAQHIKVFQTLASMRIASDPAIVKCYDKERAAEKSPIVKMIDNDRKNNERKNNERKKGGRMVDMQTLMGGKPPNTSSRGTNTGRHVSFKEAEQRRGGRGGGGGAGGAGGGGNDTKLPKKSTGQQTRLPQIPKRIPVRFASDKKDGFLNLQKGGGRTPQTSPKKRSRSNSLVQPGEFAKSKDPVKYDGDFDFDQGLEEFKELVIEKSKKTKDLNDSQEPDELHEEEENDQHKEIAKETYNKEKSFFDNLSTSAEVQGLRMDRRKEMLTNTETFGSPFIAGRRRFYRAPYRRYHHRQPVPAH